MSRKLLLVDDDRLFAQVVSAAGAGQGWDAAGEDGAVDGLMVDPATGSNAGFGLLMRLRELQPDGRLPVLAVLGSDQPASRAMLKELGIAWTVKGRLNPDRLMAHFDRTVNLARLPPSGEFPALLRQARRLASDPTGDHLLLPYLADRLIRALAPARSLGEALEGFGGFLLERFPLSGALLAVPEPYGPLTIRVGLSGLPDAAPLFAAIPPDFRPSADMPCRYFTATAPYPRDPGDAPQPEGVQAVRLEALQGWLVFAGSAADPAIAAMLQRVLRMAVPILSGVAATQALDAKVNHVFRVFSRFLPGEVIEDLLRKNADSSLLTGESRQIVALFSHIRDFAIFEENNDPSDLVRFLNRHFSLYAGIIRKHGGAINKYIGDAVFAIFGAPTSHRDNAARALRAAVEIQEELARLPRLDIAYPESGYHAGIGLNIGPAIVGNIGSRDSFDYTAIGDTINLAARLESLCKHYRLPILLSDEFRLAVERDDPSYRFRLVDRARVKGKVNATVFHTLDTGGINEDGFDRLYRQGLAMFRLGNWLTAHELFRAASGLRPDDHLATLYLERCTVFLADPPANWNGAITLKFK